MTIHHQNTVKVLSNFANSPETEEYEVDANTSTQQLITKILMRHNMTSRDPNLFYLTLEGWNTGENKVKDTITVYNDSRPLVLQEANKNCKFSMHMRAGGLIKIHDSCLMPGSHYKSLFISKKTTTRDVIGLLLSSYQNSEQVENFNLVLQGDSEKNHRILKAFDFPLQVHQENKAKEIHLTRVRDLSSGKKTNIRDSNSQPISSKRISEMNSTLSNQQHSNSNPSHHLITHGNGTHSNSEIGSDDMRSPREANISRLKDSFRWLQKMRGGAGGASSDSGSSSTANGHSRSSGIENKMTSQALLDATSSKTRTNRVPESKSFTDIRMVASSDNGNPSAKGTSSGIHTRPLPNSSDLRHRSTNQQSNTSSLIGSTTSRDDDDSSLHLPIYYKKVAANVINKHGLADIVSNEEMSRGNRFPLDENFNYKKPIQSARDERNTSEKYKGRSYKLPNSARLPSDTSTFQRNQPATSSHRLPRVTTNPPPPSSFTRAKSLRVPSTKSHNPTSNTSSSDVSDRLANLIGPNAASKNSTSSQLRSRNVTRTIDPSTRKPETSVRHQSSDIAHRTSLRSDATNYRDVMSEEESRSHVKSTRTAGDVLVMDRRQLQARGEKDDWRGMSAEKSPLKKDAPLPSPRADVPISSRSGNGTDRTRTSGYDTLQIDSRESSQGDASLSSTPSSIGDGETGWSTRILHLDSSQTGTIIRRNVNPPPNPPIKTHPTSPQALDRQQTDARLQNNNFRKASLPVSLSLATSMTQTDTQLFNGTATQPKKSSQHPSLYEIARCARLFHAHIQRISSLDKVGISCSEFLFPNPNASLHPLPGGRRPLIGQSSSKDSAFSVVSSQSSSTVSSARYTNGCSAVEEHQSVLCVDHVIKGSLAERAGLKSSDLIIEINGTNVISHSASQAHQLLDSLSSLELLVARLWTNHHDASSKTNDSDNLGSRMKATFFSQSKTMEPDSNEFNLLRQKVGQLEQEVQTKERLLAELQTVLSRKVKVRHVGPNKPFPERLLERHSFCTIRDGHTDEKTVDKL